MFRYGQASIFSIFHISPCWGKHHYPTGSPVFYFWHTDKCHYCCDNYYLILKFCTGSKYQNPTLCSRYVNKCCAQLRLKWKINYREIIQKIRSCCAGCSSRQGKALAQYGQPPLSPAGGKFPLIPGLAVALFVSPHGGLDLVVRNRTAVDERERESGRAVPRRAVLLSLWSSSGRGSAIVELYV